MSNVEIKTMTGQSVDLSKLAVPYTLTASKFSELLSDVFGVTIFTEYPGLTYWVESIRLESCTGGCECLAEICLDAAAKITDPELKLWYTNCPYHIYRTKKVLLSQMVIDRLVDIMRAGNCYYKDGSFLTPSPYLPSDKMDEAIIKLNDKLKWMGISFRYYADGTSRQLEVDIKDNNEEYDSYSLRSIKN